MPPPMPNPSKRITANPIRPARYRPGKAVPEEESSDEDEEEEVKASKAPVVQPRPRAQPQRFQAPVHQEDDDDDEEGFETDEDDEAPTASTTKTAIPRQIISTADTPLIEHSQVRHTLPNPRQASDEESEQESEEDSSSVEEESSSEEEPQRKLLRPTFIRKADRQKSPTASAAVNTNDTTIIASSNAELEEQTRRLAQADLYIKDKLERDARARAQGKKAWDDDEELDPEAQVDDTDGLDAAAEHAAWKLRELKRLKRDREVIEVREKEIEESERRRNLTQAERDAEDQEYLEKQREERDAGRGKANFLAKYHHKGAFFQDDEMAEVLKKRDIMGAKFQDDVSDKTVLPEYMRIRDMNKLGKKGRTRYKDLKNEDTGRFGDAVKRWRGSGYDNRGEGGMAGEAMRGVDERFLPDSDRNGDRGDARGPTGANASAVGQRRERRYSDTKNRSRSRSRSPRRRRDSRSREHGGDRDREGEKYRPRRRSRSRSDSHSRSRSRTPPRRKRSPSPRRYDDSERDKRRRVEVDY